MCFSRWTRTRVVAMVALCGLSAWAAPASAGFVLDAKYSGVVNDISDPYGIFGPVTLGDSVSGIVRYSSPTRPPDFGDDTQAEYHFPVTPGGYNLMTANLGALHLQSTQNVIAVVYNQPDPNSPADSIFGYDFQFNDGDTSLMTTTGLPAGDRVRYVDPDIGLYVTDPSLFDPPNPPSMLLPIEQYSDSIYTGGASTR